MQIKHKYSTKYYVVSKKYIPTDLCNRIYVDTSLKYLIILSLDLFLFRLASSIVVIYTITTQKIHYQRHNLRIVILTINSSILELFIPCVLINTYLLNFLFRLIFVPYKT